ncbi:plasmid replication initiator protein [Streptomyces daliensis]|uniref:Plasmid replication initiator protein n=1 Tax=Streptomyces daliensis TaxID=299421 RepID=A0A8T4ITA4_9ACTN|nr:plasmid replication initiator protein [Streptomyces daliensis]
MDRDLLYLIRDPLFGRWREQITAIGGCAKPVYLSGSTVTYHPGTGEVVSSYSTGAEPGERLPVRCRNRRASVCEPCSRLHSGDTFHLVRAGLSGGKSVPESVRERPRLFVTLTAPSFGRVHRVTEGGPCRLGRGGGVCAHGVPLGCGLVHAEGDPLAGAPLCGACYDFAGHVLWHAHAGRLWDRFTTAVRRHLASAGGVPRSRLGEHVVVSFAKVAEFQQRAAVHFHAVVRLDGPEGPGSPAPSWASGELLAEAVAHAAAHSFVTVPESAAYGTERCTWGERVDIQPVRSFAEGDDLSDAKVAAYVAKYVSKSAADTGAGLDARVTRYADIRASAVSRHTRALMGTCWRLGGLPELAHLRLRASAHTLGYRGHVLTKSRRYSTTYAALRAERAEHLRALEGRETDDPETVTEASWRFVGSGHSPGAALLAAGIAEDLVINREVAREELGAASWEADA